MSDPDTEVRMESPRKRQNLQRWQQARMRRLNCIKGATERQVDRANQLYRALHRLELKRGKK